MMYKLWEFVHNILFINIVTIFGTKNEIILLYNGKKRNKKINAMKTKVTQIIIALLVLMTATNAYADNNKGKKEKKATAEKVIRKLEKRIEKDLSLETWMYELREFAGREIFTENTPELEEWMMHTFTTVSESGFSENELVFEPWMLSAFNTENGSVFTEEEMEFEPWMMTTFNNNTQDQDFTEEEMEFEPWMLKKF